MTDIKYKMGDYFYYIAHRKHHDYPYRQVLGQVTNVVIEEISPIRTIQTMAGIMADYTEHPQINVKVYYNEIYSNHKINQMEGLHFTQESPMGQGSILCTEDEIKLLRLFYE